jgi:hypothetical protein
MGLSKLSDTLWPVILCFVAISVMEAFALSFLYSGEAAFPIGLLLISAFSARPYHHKPS